MLARLRALAEAALAAFRGDVRGTVRDPAMRIALEGGDLGSSPDEKVADEKAAAVSVLGGTEARETGGSGAAGLANASVKRCLLYVGAVTGVHSTWSGGGVLAWRPEAIMACA